LKLIETSSRSESKIYFVGSLGGFIFLGFLVGNSGLAESSAIFIALITLAVGLQLSTKSNIFSRFRLAINSHLLGVAIGLATILLAPGFVNRNSRLGKIDEGALSLITGFRSALVSFSGEVLTHPVWLFGILVIPFFAYLSKIDKSKARLVLIFFAINFVLLILGSTFGYAAWHQSSGLILLLTPASFCIPIVFIRTQTLLKRLRLINKPYALTVVALVLAILLIRGLVVQENRSSQWDFSLIQNYCLTIESNELPLLGAEIRYWPIDLGIEDVNRWDWMAQEYKSWLRTIEFKGSQICE
jgi:hypothetical protein